MDNKINIPLDLSDVRVLEVTKTQKGEWLIRVESTLNGTVCRNCGHSIADSHGFAEPVRLRHLPLFEIPVYIELRPKRYRCPWCEGHPTSTQQLSWYEQRSPNTKAYEQWLLRILINSTVADVSQKLKISEECVTGVLERWIESEVDWDSFSSIEVLGIDEVSLKRGHRDYVTIVSALTPEGVKVLAVLKDRKKETLATYLASIPVRHQCTIQRVCIDMFRGYASAIGEQLSHAKIVVDRFHVARLYRSCADVVRKQELKRLKCKLPKAEYDLLKGVMWTFRKSTEQLSDEDWVLLRRLFDSSAKAEQAYTLREELTDIFEGDYTKSGAKCAIRAWCKRVRNSGITEFESFLTTVEHWLDEITNYFLEGLSSGFVEGFNNRVKVLKRRCYGLFNVQHLFQRLTLDLNDYQRFAPTH